MKCSFCSYVFAAEKGVKLHLRLCLCKKVQYCDKECQKRHHDQHKLVCSYFIGGDDNSEDEFEFEIPFKKRHKPLPLSSRKGFRNPTHDRDKAPPTAGLKFPPTAGRKFPPTAGPKFPSTAGHKIPSKAGLEIPPEAEQDISPLTGHEIPSSAQHQNQHTAGSSGSNNLQNLKLKQKNKSAFKTPQRGPLAHSTFSTPDHSPPNSQGQAKPPTPKTAPDLSKSKKQKPRVNSINNAERDKKTGKFTSKSGEQTDQQRRSAIIAANGRDFRQAKQRLKSIIARNKEGGENWEFKIESQKKFKGAKHQYHCWTSSNYSSMGNSKSDMNSPSSEDEDPMETYPVQSSKRVCTNCKHPIVGPQWSYIVCKGDRCRNGMSHFSCLGFPDVSKALLKLMKQEYECPGCYASRVAALDQEADFQPLPKKQRKGGNPRLSQMLRQLRDKRSEADGARLSTSKDGIEDAETGNDSEHGDQEIVFSENDIFM